MREIKFRTWDKKYHMLEYDDSPDLLIGMDGKVYQKEERNYAGTSFIEYEVANRFELMQYTGLKDKNGKEIYEGDILQFNTDAPGVVDYFRGSCRVKTPSRYRGDDWRTSLWDATIDEYEIVGNMYENPELLEESK
ncbi:hypothetical protein BK708_40475 [Bacillus thuringiensis serovar yunnanensis]|nr:hypothetical protein BK708_40475 [Bacillus thuringiensis serovar yunnanensis]